MSVISLADYRRREGYRIIVSAGAPDRYCGFLVRVDPTTATHPDYSFASYREATAFAVALQKVEGWPIFSNCGDEPDGGRAA